MEKVLKLYNYVDGGINDTPFPNSDNPIEIGEFRYDAKRMGGAPTITASVNYPTCLDDMWSEKVYAEFNGEKYYLKQTPTSSRNNEDYRYKHNVELVSERSVLDNVYFFDVVVGDPQENDRPVSNSTKVVFFGDVREFASRLQSSLLYSGLRYTIVVDDDVVSEEKLMSFEDQFFSNVLQDIYNTYEVPYYFEGTTIHIGYSKDGVVIPDLEYGVDNALVSITKNNANVKIVNRVTGKGSSDNIPFYYPNNSPKGDVAAIESDGSQLGVKIIDAELFSDKVELNGVISYQAQEATVTRVIDDIGNTISSGSNSIVAKFTYKGFSTRYQMRITSYANGSIPLTIAPILNFYKYDNGDDKVGERAVGKTQIKIFRQGELIAKSDDFVLSKTFDIELPRGSSLLNVHVMFYPEYDSSTNWFEGSVGLSWATDSKEGWYYKEKEVKLEDLGLSISNTAPQSGSTITQELVKYVNTSPNLMPYRYRTTSGEERFYNAENRTYADENGVLYQFNNPYTEGNPKEHIITVEDIKPTIKETVNSMGLRMDMFSEFAYDIDDNDELLPEDDDSDRKFVHSYFFGKLRKLDFNLFDHAIEQQPMTISFTSGNCGACKFTIGVTKEFPQKNPVQVDANGNLVRDENGRVVCGQFAPIQEKDCQPRQQDTINNEVWIALKKEEDTYGILMPKAPKVNSSGEQIESGYRPKPCSDGNNDGDTFVILGINLPESYIINAEKKLEAEILKYMKENNDEKFTFNINFSRIYFAENENVLKSLSENSKVRIIYDNKPYDLYVSSFSYNISEGDILPDISVELDDTLNVSENAIRNAINEVKTELGRAINNVDVVGVGTPYFLRKDEDDEARGRINFQKGLTFGNGGKIDVLDNNSAKLTIDYLEVKKKATFTSLEIQEKTHVGGQMLVTPAALSCNNVEEFDDCYRCYFQTEDEGGDEIFNQFTVGDQAICQTFNAWESKYYWRLVTGIGENYIDLSKEDCDEDSDAPAIGDKIIQLGNREDSERQNAIVVAAYGDGSPYIIQYKGINSFALPDDKIVTKLSSTENIFTGKVHMEAGSNGLSDLQEFADLQSLAGSANTNAANAQNKATSAIAVADNAQRSADTANTNALQAGDAAKAANEKAEEAIEKADSTKEALDNMSVGGANLIRNSGFIGNHLSEDIVDESVLESSSELYNDPFAHWTPGSQVTRVELTDVATSGFGAHFGGSSMSQSLYYSLIKDEVYTLSLKAKADVEYDSSVHHMTISCGGASFNISATTGWEKYIFTFVAKTSSTGFSLQGVDITICDIKLERGNVATSWSDSIFDNSSDRAYYQSMKYIQNAFEGATDISGGLVLTEQIQVGDYDSENKKWVKMNGGMSGSYESDQDVAFWAGGNFTQAINAVMKYDNDPTYQPTTEELASMANFVVTHGGRAILNDAIIRGTIYAKDGDFTGTIHAKDGEFTGKIESTDGHIGGFQISGNRIGIDQGGTNDGMFLYDSFIGFRESGSSYNSFTAVGENVLSAISGTIGLARFELDGSKDSLNQYTNGYGLMVDVKGYGNPYAFYCTNGVFAGLRYNTTVIKNTSKYTLTRYDHTIVIDVASGTGQIELPKNPEQGQRYEIYTTVAGMDLNVYMNGQHEMYNLIDAKKFAADEVETYTADKRRHITIFFAGGIWFSDYRYLEK